MAVHNLSAEPVTTRLQLAADDLGERPVRLDDLFAHEEVEVSARGLVDLTLEAYGHRWLRLAVG